MCCSPIALFGPPYPLLLPVGPQRCVIETLLSQYGPKIRLFQTDGIAEHKNGRAYKRKRYTNVCDFTAECL